MLPTCSSDQSPVAGHRGPPSWHLPSASSQPPPWSNLPAVYFLAHFISSLSPDKTPMLSWFVGKAVPGARVSLAPPLTSWLCLHAKCAPPGAMLPTQALPFKGVLPQASKLLLGHQLTALASFFSGCTLHLILLYKTSAARR